MSTTDLVLDANYTKPRGMDVSHYQGHIDWEVVGEGAEYAFAFAKATEGTTYVDPFFPTNWVGMKDAGMLRGAYHFFRPNMDPVTQAAFFVNVIGPQGQGDLQPMLDVEVSGGLSPQALVQRIRACADHIKTLLRRDPIIYTYPYFWKSATNNSNAFHDFPLWIAHYTNAPAPSIVGAWPWWTFWQYTASGRVEGIRGDVDLSLFNGTNAQLRKFAGYS